MYGSESLYEFLDWFPRLEGHAFHGHEILTWLRVRTWAICISSEGSGRQRCIAWRKVRLWAKRLQHSQICPGFLNAWTPASPSAPGFLLITCESQYLTIVSNPIMQALH